MPDPLSEDLLSYLEMARIAMAFTRLHLTHPRADKYGLPLAAAAGYEEFGKIVVSNLGYRPSALEMETQVEDSEDDSPESYVLTFAYPHTEESANLFRD